MSLNTNHFHKNRPTSRTLKSGTGLSFPVLFLKNNYISAFAPDDTFTNISRLNSSWYMTICQHTFIEYIFLPHIVTNIQVILHHTDNGNLSHGTAQGIGLHRYTAINQAN